MHNFTYIRLKLQVFKRSFKNFCNKFTEVKYEDNL